VASDLLSHARELERRDAAVAGELETVVALSTAVASLRGRVDELRAARTAFPGEHERLVALRLDAEAEVSRSTAELETAEARLAAVESSRRRREDDLDRAAKEAATAREALEDAQAQVERVAESLAQLEASERDVEREEAELGRRAEALAAEIGSLPRIPESATRDLRPGLDGLSEWASHVRSTLFVARGVLEQERDRIVTEANALGSAVLGEPLGGSSATLVRERLEAALR
jgi:chromosome segregation ATPase